MKKELMIMLGAALLGTVCFSNITAEKASAKTSGDYQYVITGKKQKTCAIRKYTGKDKDVKIPSKLDGYTVTRIGNLAFAKNMNIQSVTFPKRVTKIGRKAFKGCENLKKIKFSDNIHTIEREAFYLCMELKDVSLPSKLKKLGNYAFDYCPIKDISIPQYVESIGYESFDRIGLDSITVDEKNKTYDSRENCNALIKTSTNTIIYGSNKSTVPSTVTAIGEEAFYNCRKLKEITIPAGFKTIGNSAFQDCDALEKVSFSEGLKKIGDGAFFGCSSLKDIKLPDSLETIGGYAFQDCKKISNINIPKDLIKTDDFRKIFQSCDIKSISVADGNKFYDSRDNCNGVIETATNTLVLGCENTNIPDSVKVIGNNPFVTVPSELIIPEGVEELSDNAFYFNEDLKKISLPSTLKSIGSGAFWDCCSIREITIPEGIAEIKDDTFNHCEKLEKITLPSSLKSIGLFAFNYCGSLKEISIPDGTCEIKENAFNYCEKLKKITLPSTLKSIGSNAFLYCPLVTVNYKGSKAEWKKIKIDDVENAVEDNWWNKAKIICNYKG